MIIGVTGYATEGKDEVANVLVARWGFVKESWAAPIRRDLCILDPIVGSIRSRFKVRRWDVTYSEALDTCGYVEAKSMFPEFRRLMQVYGTDVHRTISEDYWIKRTLASFAPQANYVIPDVRFSNEAKAVDYLIRVVRPGVSPINDHPSDAGLAFPSVTHTVVNDGDLIQLADRVHELAQSLDGLS